MLSVLSKALQEDNDRRCERACYVIAAVGPVRDVASVLPCQHLCENGYGSKVFGD